MNNEEYKNEVVVDEIFSGSFIIDQPLSEQEQKEKIYALMEEAGIKIENKDDLIIGYDGVEDQNGISETQTTKFVVYKKSIKKVKNTKDNEVEELKKQLEELKSLRNKLSKKNYSSNRVEKLTRKTEKIKKQAIKDDSIKNLNNSLEKIDLEINNIEKRMKKDAISYEKCYKDLKAIIENEQKILNNTNLYKEEELREIEEEYTRLKLEVNEKSLEIKKKIDTNKKMLTSLKRKKNSIKRDIERKDALGLSYKEYEDLTSTVRKRKIMNAILARKGLDSIISKKATERTKEEKKIIKEAKEEIMKEIAEYKNNNQDASILESIEVLYSLDINYKKVKSPRVTILTEEEFNNLKRRVNDIPGKIISSDNKSEEVDYIPEKQPEDLNDIGENISIEDVLDNPISEKITILRIPETNKLYVREYTIDKLGLKPIGEGIKLDNSTCYEITQEDKNYIIENANISSSYIVEIKEVENKKSDINEKITIYKNNNSFYANTYLIQKFGLNPIGFGVKINNILCFNISEEDKNNIIENANKSTHPYTVEIKEEAVDELESFNYKNEKVSSSFLQELKNNEYGYNVIKTMPDDMVNTIISDKELDEMFSKAIEELEYTKNK
ncbi:MAG: hypothetical protein IJ097_02640 [Bacilli bacterium]|nr:hypothetical protein [Bacilli bacterium]